MSILLFVLVALQATGDPVVAPPAVPTIPTDWRALAPLPVRVPLRTDPQTTAFVASEVAAGRCAAAKPAAGGMALAIDVAVQVRPSGRINAAVPRAIDCPTIEQFAAGIVARSARNNLRRGAAGWYIASLTFAWGP